MGSSGVCEWENGRVGLEGYLPAPALVETANIMSMDLPYSHFGARCSVERVGGSRPLEIVHTGTFCTSYPPSFVRVLRLFKTSFVINFVVVWNLTRPHTHSSRTDTHSQCLLDIAMSHALDTAFYRAAFLWKTKPKCKNNDEDVNWRRVRGIANESFTFSISMAECTTAKQ